MRNLTETPTRVKLRYAIPVMVLTLFATIHILILKDNLVLDFLWISKNSWQGWTYLVISIPFNYLFLLMVTEILKFKLIKLPHWSRRYKKKRFYHG